MPMYEDDVLSRAPRRSGLNVRFTDNSHETPIILSKLPVLPLVGTATRADHRTRRQLPPAAGY